ncbi:hypothetical protein M2451_002809 [Dysgonomonas sp. PFB1-18]|uniref:hypothetical protein n=1 Tax=unclassified Dysgonomonas TaxID=2630389 RepID=UPI00247522D9|nr:MULTISPECIES: hypothetical protein [unclassified Dysgonomonas]MDH6309305.1 hypothetical protein [Dysgonomonas sp. PF1-14]MDH6339830.1 hypothetical protein [Dysgonomonas sp. PF1-16]MDH6381478.1 hypothetical protein [Dysgonomonas sp. PFB1-18]MDH6398693.1 hypothetical protein [Dysgonomonas sp. PF1-23]
MKRISFVFMSILALAAINCETAAQSVYFGNDVYSNGTNTLNANVYSSEAATPPTTLLNNPFLSAL